MQIQTNLSEISFRITNYISLLLILLLSTTIKPMSRNNVFKLSGNMALSNKDQYGQHDYVQIKDSMRLLKTRQKLNDAYEEPHNVKAQYNQYGYSGPYSSKLPQRASDQNSRSKLKKYSDNPQYRDYGQMAYEKAAKNHVPSNYKDNYEYKDALYNQMESYSKPDIRKSNRRANNDDERAPIQIVEKPRPRNQVKEPVYEPQKNYQDYGQNKIRGNRRDEPKYLNPRQNYEQPQYQKSIREINKENRIEIVQYDPSSLIPCRAGCGRKFNPDSIKKHESICKKVFQRKRKEFNAQEHRIISNEQKKLMKKGEIVEKKIQQMKAKQKIPKWKAESLALRAGIKLGKNKNYVPTRQEQEIMDQSKKAGTVKCPYCGRSFNDQAGPRHISFCQQQNKKIAMKGRR